MIKKDFLGMMEVMVDLEMKMFENIKTPVIFLQNVITDLLLGLGMTDFLVAFHRYISRKYDAEAGFITMNLPLLLNSLKKSGIFNPIVCASINKTGFRMPGGKTTYEDVIEKSECRLIAMQVFAAGTLSPREALQYVCNMTGVTSILFGASSKTNIEETRKLIQEYSNPTLVPGIAV